MSTEKLAALEYHSKSPKGKIETVLSKPLESQEDLVLAYSPGVAYPCLEIHNKEIESYNYTGRSNLVGIVTDGSAVLGLGNIGPHASKPVMEGKAMLFKKFGKINAFDIELDASDPQKFIEVAKALEPTFGGINLEDIKAPECFVIEETLKREMDIPVFHDDQHGTAIITAAAFINALEIADKNIESVKVVFSGAGAAAIACAKLLVSMGVPKGHIIMCDSKGVIYKGRNGGMNKYKDQFASESEFRTLEDAIAGADCFIGVSVKGALSQNMVKSMAKDPIIFALANPDPEILPSEALAIRSDAIVATGRSDLPNQVNNVLGFPSIFRGALDTHATGINEDMKIAAVKAIAALTKEEIPEQVKKVYGEQTPKGFGRDYLIPKPVDNRLLMMVAPAVAEAAMRTNVARKNINIEDYKKHIENIS